VPDFAASAAEVFSILRSFDYTVLLYDDLGRRVEEPSEARRMFAKQQNLLVSLTDAGADSSVRLFIGKSTKINEILGLVTSLRTAATKFNMLFNVRQYGREINPKDFATTSAVTEGAHATGEQVAALVDAIMETAASRVRTHLAHPTHSRDA
jgi:hypothetical protein